MRHTLTGLDAWLVQRVSAVYLLVFIVLACAHFLFDPPASFEEWRDWVRDPVVSTAGLLGCAAVLLHAWVGLRDVILDYVHPPAARFTALVLLGIGIAAMAAWMARVVLG